MSTKICIKLDGLHSLWKVTRYIQFLLLLNGVDATLHIDVHGFRCPVFVYHRLLFGIDNEARSSSPSLGSARPQALQARKGNPVHELLLL